MFKPVLQSEGRGMTRRLANADDRPRVHIWPHSLVDRFHFSFGPTGCRSRQAFASIGETIEAASMHAGGFKDGAVIIVEPRP